MKEERLCFHWERGLKVGRNTQGRVSAHWGVTESMGGHTRIYIYVFMCMCVYVYKYVHMYVYLYVYMYVCMNVCVCVYM